MAKVLNKSAIIAHLSKKSKLPKKTVAEVYDELLTLAAREAKRGVVLPAFAKLVSGGRAAAAIRPQVIAEPREGSKATVTRKAEALTRKDLLRVFEAWQKDRAPRHLSLFLTGLQSPSSDVRDMAMYALSAAGSTARPRLVNVLKDKTALWPALRLLHEIGDPKARSAVRPLLGQYS